MPHFQKFKDDSTFTERNHSYFDEPTRRMRRKYSHYIPVLSLLDLVIKKQGKNYEIGVVKLIDDLGVSIGEFEDIIQFLAKEGFVDIKITNKDSKSADIDDFVLNITARGRAFLNSKRHDLMLETSYL